MLVLLFILRVLCPAAQYDPYGTATKGNTIASRFQPPSGFHRAHSGQGTFANWAAELPLLPAGTLVSLYNGDPKGNQEAHVAVLDLSVGKKDLQQCADAVMRLRAEYLFSHGRSSEIQFNFTNGFHTAFDRWAKGDRIRVKDNVCTWVRTAAADRSHAALLSYLETVFTYAGTLSLSRELNSATGTPVQAGDVFIHGGSPGHAVMVLDVATHADGRQAFLIAQSYMPAQQVHVLKNPRRPELGAWYILNEGELLHTPEWTFSWSDRKRW